MIPGAGMGGNVLLVARLRALGAPGSAAMATLLVSMLGYYLAYAILALLMLLILWSNGEATPLLTGIVTTLLMVALAVPSLALWLCARGQPALVIPPRAHRDRPLAARDRW